jgi:hypothetical protein
MKTAMLRHVGAPTPFGKLRPESREHIFVGEGKSHAIQKAALSDDAALSLLTSSEGLTL